VSALFLTAGLVVGVAPAASADVQAQATRSISCDNPSGNKVNFSWSNSGLVTTTLYFNNHCSTSQRVTVKLNNAVVDQVCLVTGAGVKSSVRYNATSISDVTKGC